MNKKRPKEVIIFATLIILGSLYQMFALKLDLFKTLLQPLPEKIILAHFFISATLLILGVISAIGILYLKNTFRKIVLFIAFYTLYTYLIESPLFILRNFHIFVEQSTIEFISRHPDIPASFVSLATWSFAIITWIIDFTFAICLIYYFTRPKVKEQFRKKLITTLETTEQDVSTIENRL